MPASVRILVVDDFVPFRNFVSAILIEGPHLKIIGEASDGEEAIHMAATLKPDVILLDISMPKMNGLAAANKICVAAPDTKIIFVSAECSLDVVQAALVCGAAGYLIKSYVASELVPAINDAMLGRTVLSKCLKGVGIRH